ncbi:MAG: type II toxin-antitoxin system HicA family toxin [Candidatus Kapaibacterium sp.]|nr:MAG: type II toxin-antitoxin system HicA family toxin [Candidatus Kapabacteria bacterium]
MSEHLPSLSGKECVKALMLQGWVEHRQRGSHIILQKQGFPRGLCIPNHKTLDKGTLASIIRQAGLTPEEFRQLL